MMKWLKRLLLAAVFVAVFVGVLALAAWWLSHGTPEWYGRKRATPQELAAAAHRAEQQVQRTLNWASEQGRPPHASSTQPADSFKISFTEDELNGFFQKWDNTFGWSEHYSSFLSDPQIVIEDGRLIAAATVTDMNSVLSAEFQPRLDEGELRVPVTRVLAGRLPLPQSFWDRYRGRAEAAVTGRLPTWQQTARITADGNANASAVAAAMSELLLDLLDQRPARPVLFLPYLKNGEKSLPVKLTGLEVGDKTLTLTVRAMTPLERQALIEHVRAWRSTEATADDATK